MLGDRPDTVWDAELFEPRRRDKVRELEEGLDPGAMIRTRRDGQPDEADVFAIVYLTSLHLGVLGMSLDEMLAMLNDAGVDHIVAIRRRNYLRRLVSGAVGRERGQFHQHARDGDVELTTVRMDPDSIPLGPHKPLLDALAGLEREEQQLVEALQGREHVWVDFEDHIEQDPTIAYEQVCAFAGLPPVDVDVRLVRTTDFSLDQVIENYDEVAGTLHGTRFAWMLHG